MSSIAEDLVALGFNLQREFRNDAYTKILVLTAVSTGRPYRINITNVASVPTQNIPSQNKTLKAIPTGTRFRLAPLQSPGTV